MTTPALGGADYFFFQAEDGIRDGRVTGVQTCALPIYFYLALGSGKLQAGQIVNKVIQRLKTDQVAEEEAVPLKAPKARHAVSSDNVGINVRGVDDVLVRLAKCCTAVPGDKIVGYISLGKGITIHREDCSNVKSLRRNPERFTKEQSSRWIVIPLPSEM